MLITIELCLVVVFLPLMICGTLGVFVSRNTQIVKTRNINIVMGMSVACILFLVVRYIGEVRECMRCE